MPNKSRKSKNKGNISITFQAEAKEQVLFEEPDHIHISEL